MATDLFDLFPDLPWSRIEHPPPRVWSQRELPPPPRPRHMFRDRDRGASEESALRRIYVIALRERERLTPRSDGARALDQIIDIVRAAL
jgi:hypothetical protein